jgi:hypothetical protein
VHVAGAAAIAEPDVQIAVRAEGEMPPIVVRFRLGNSATRDSSGAPPV